MTFIGLAAGRGWDGTARLAMAAIMALLVPAGAAVRADVPQQTPWHPVAAAHLYGVFASALKPVDWQGIEQRFATNSDKFSHRGDKTVYALLRPVARFAGVELGAAIQTALRDRDPVRLRAASRRAVSAAVRYHLDRARRNLDRGQPAVPDVLRAEGLYRGLARGLKGTDTKTYREVGLAWLQLTTAAVRPAAASQAAFDSAATAIKSYLDANAENLSTGTATRAGIRLPPDADMADQSPLPRLVLNFESRGVDQKDLFLVAYGDMLFDSPEIYGAMARRLGITCAACHNRGDINQRFFIPGLSARRGGVDVDSALFNPRANDHRFDPIDIPSLRGIRFTAPYGRDGRIASLREFARAVIVTEFGGPEPTPLMLDAMVAYLNEFDFLPAPNLRRDGRLKASAPAAARRGEVLFNRRFAGMGGRSCAGCHMPDANFVDGRRHDIGSVAPASADGRGSALDTPTLLGINYTAPYFHDGSLATLADVVGWFDKRFSLGLDRRQTDDLLAYLVAVGTGARPYETFDDTRTPARLAFEELSVFISTLDTLIPARNRFHAELLIRTVARDLRADAPGMSNIRSLPRAYLLADRLEAIGRAVAGSDWRGAAGLWADYKTTERAYASQLY